MASGHKERAQNKAGVLSTVHVARQKTRDRDGVCVHDDSLTHMNDMSDVFTHMTHESIRTSSQPFTCTTITAMLCARAYRV